MADLKKLLRPLPWTVAILLLVPSLAHADYWDDFKDARDAVEAKDWKKAEALLRSAIAAEPEAKRRTFGARYTPYYYLGIVLQETGDCRAALEAWKTSEGFDGVKSNSDESRDRAKRKSRCEQLVGDARQARTGVEQIVSRGRSAIKGLDRLSSNPSLAEAWQSGDPSFADRRRDAAGLLDRAERKASQGDSELDLDLLAEAKHEAESAVRALDALGTDAEARLDAASAARNKTARDLDGMRQEAENLLASVASLAPYPPQLERRVGALRRNIGQAEQRRDDADVDELNHLIDSLEKGMRALRARSAAPPKALAEAARAFLDHDYQGVIDRLADAELEGERERFHASLLRAASYHGLYVLGGAEDEGLLGKTRYAVRECLALDPEGEKDLGRPGERWLSPSFRALWDATAEEVRAEAAEAAADGESVDETGSEDAP